MLRQDDLLTKIAPQAAKDGFTQLHIAADFGKLDMVQQILEREGSTNLEATDYKWGNTPLFRAVFSGHDGIVKLLLEQKANPNTANKDNVSAVYQAASMGRHSVMKLLADAKANLEAKSASGQTPLHGACLNNQTESIKMLLELKADPNTTTKSGVHALYMATERGNIPAIKLLVDGKAEINATSSDGITALMRAAYKGQSEAVKVLVELGADVWMQGMGQTAASWATKQGQNEIAQYLLVEMAKQQQKKGGRQQQQQQQQQQQPGFNLCAVDPEGFTLLHRAAEAGNVQLIAQLISLKADVEAKDATWQNTPLFRAVLADKPLAVAELLKARARVDSPNKDGVSPLYQACAIGNFDTIKLLIQYKANVEHKSTFDQTPLHAACLNGKTAAVRLLVDHNVDLEAVTRSKVGALYMAAERGHVDVIKVLVGAKADINSLGPDRITPLMRAAYKNQGQAAKVLLELNADPSCVAMGKTAAQWAEQQGNHDIISILNEPVQQNAKRQATNDMVDDFEDASKAQKIESEQSAASSKSHAASAKRQIFILPSLVEILKRAELLHRHPDFVSESLDDVSLLLSLTDDDLSTTGTALKLKQGEVVKLKQALRDVRAKNVRPATNFNPSSTFSPRPLQDANTQGYIMHDFCESVEQVLKTEVPSPSSTPETAQSTPEFEKMVQNNHATTLRKVVVVSHGWSVSQATSPSETEYTTGPPLAILDIDERALEPTGQVIGTGSQANVSLVMWQAQNEPKKQYAFKKAHKIEEAQRSLEQEVQLCCHIPPHPNIARPVAVVREPSNKISGTLLDYHPLGSLDRLKLFRIHPDDLLPGIRGLAKAIAHLHDLGIVHRDIASRNVLVTTSKNFVLSDFGLSRVGEHHLLENEKLPWRTLAPEILKARQDYPRPQPKPVFTAKSDMWAFGVLLWELCNAKEAYTECKDITEAQLGILSKTIKLPLKETVLAFPTLAPVLVGCLQYNSEDRPNAKEVLLMLGETRPAHKFPDRRDAQYASNPRPTITVERTERTTRGVRNIELN